MGIEKNSKGEIEAAPSLKNNERLEKSFEGFAKLSKKEQKDAAELSFPNVDGGKEQDQKLSPADVDSAIGKALDGEIKKMGEGNDTPEVQKQKNELLERVQKIQDPLEKFKAYSEALEGLRAKIGVNVKEERINNEDYSKAVQNQSENQAKQSQESFLSLGKKIREMIDKTREESRNKSQEQMKEGKEKGNKEQVESKKSAGEALKQFP